MRVLGFYAETSGFVNLARFPAGILPPGTQISQIEGFCGMHISTMHISKLRTLVIDKLTGSAYNEAAFCG